MFWSGQTQYPGSVSGFKTTLAEAHKVGVKAITYGKACACGINGFNTFQRHPEFFGHEARIGPVSEMFNTFYLELMRQNLYTLPGIDGGPRPWQHWASLWTNFASDAAVDFGADEILASSKMLGWDGVRWDGHFAGNMARFKQRVNAQHPGFIHAYNVAFANPGSEHFLPSPPVDDFHEICKDHGVIMDESVRSWSHTNYSSGVMRPFYDAICREADYVKRADGLPLFITFDIGSPQDKTLNILMGLAAGERYTYITAPQTDFAFGSLPKFLTRFSAMEWDDTAMIAKAGDVVKVNVGKSAAKDAKPWFEQSTWLRKLPSGREQLLVNLINPPGYPAFCNREQPAPATLENVSVAVRASSGAKVTRVVHVSPDLVDGYETLEASSTVVVPRVRLWSIVAFEFDGPTGL
jgi:hypothetical protein